MHNADTFAPHYGITTSLGDAPFDAAVEATKRALAGHGFGVLTEIDMKATMKKKLNVDMDEYLILGACNPGYAWQAVGAEAAIGLLLPCNVVVTRQGGEVLVSAVDPRAMFKVIDRPDVAPIADEVHRLLSRAIADVAL